MAKSHKARNGTNCTTWKDTVYASRSQARARSKRKRRQEQQARARTKVQAGRDAAAETGSPVSPSPKERQPK